MSVQSALDLFAAEGTALPTTDAAAVFGDVIDTGGDGINDVDDLYAVLGITTTVTSGGAATVDFQLVSADDAALTTNVVVHYDSGAIAKATLVAGYRVFAVELPRGTYKRYLGILCTPAVAVLTAGAAYAALEGEPPTWKAFKAGI
jgi:Bbp16